MHGRLKKMKDCRASLLCITSSASLFHKANRQGQEQKVKEPALLINSVQA
jgi:hypothetical protein